MARPAVRLRQTTETKKLREVFQDKRFNVRSVHRFSIINVGQTRSFLSEKATLRFLHEPEDNDFSHCGMYGTEYNDEVVQDMIAESVISIVPAMKLG